MLIPFKKTIDFGCIFLRLDPQTIYEAERESRPSFAMQGSHYIAGFEWRFLRATEIPRFGEAVDAYIESTLLFKLEE
jgi:hypothetical protein